MKLFVFDSKNDRKIIAPYRKNKNIEIIYGNLKDRELVDRWVDGADYVLHIGAMVSPLADRYPEETMKVNLGSTLNIINAIKKQDNADEIGLVEREVQVEVDESVERRGGRIRLRHHGRRAREQARADADEEFDQ